MERLTPGTLVEFHQLQNLKESSLQWLADNMEVRTFEKGDFLFKKGDPVENLHLIVSGEFEIYSQEEGSKKAIGLIQKGGISGLLPFSRLKNASGFGRATQHSKVASLNKSRFKEMITDHYELTETFVHEMNNRIRSFTQVQVQNEKLIALGKIAAGLAHELNNPASAMVRSAALLHQHLSLLPEGFKAVIKIRADDDTIDAINELMFRKIDQPYEYLSLMERAEREDAFIDWFENCEVGDPDDLINLLVEYNFSVDDLLDIKNKLRDEDFYPVLHWIIQNMTTQKTVSEISEASKRIEGLIKSVKSYSYMDRNPDFQPVDVHEGIRNTLTIMNHKLEKAGHAVLLDFDEAVTTVHGLPGELNQVWTNIIDNAIDALPQKDGQLHISTKKTDNFVIIHITDNGTGIPEDVKNHIFEPFYTTKEVGKGTGLGLSTVMKIMQHHKGEIKVQSVPGQTIVELCFPI